jgi:hypothetical protein
MITDATPFHIDYVAVDDPSSVWLRQQLKVDRNDFNFGGTTNIVVVYALDNVVGGALINLTPTIVMVTRMCTYDAEHSVAIVNYLRDRFDRFEIHLNVVCTSMQLYLNLDFVKRNRSPRCTCAVIRNESHLCWVPPVVPQVVAVKIGNNIFYAKSTYETSS